MPPARRPLVGLALLLAASAPPAVRAAELPLSRIAFGSCADQDKPLPIFDAVAAQKPDLLVLLGDNIYADLDKSKKVTTDVIREKYAALDRLPGWQKLRAACPILATWDDHDYGKNDAGAEYPLKDDSQAAFLDFWKVPADSPRRTQKGIYSSAVFGPAGQRVQVILLDTRYFRSELKYGPPLRYTGGNVVRKPYVPNTDPAATMLGADQWAWLAEQLKVPAEVRLLCSSVQVVADDHPFEKWANMPGERAKLLALLKESGAAGVVILSGDRHLAELCLDTTSVGYPLYDLTSSGFNQGAKNWRAPDTGTRRVGSMAYGDNFGTVFIDWSQPDPRITLQVRDEDGDVTIGQKVRLSSLKAGAVAGGRPAGLAKVSADEKKEEPKRPEGVLSPEEAVKKEGMEVTVQFTVAGGRAINPTLLLLNSEKDFKSEKNVTVALRGKAMTGKWEKATYDTFKGKTVKATGTVKKFKEQFQIEITDEKNLELVEDKPDEKKPEDKKSDEKK